MMGWEWEGVLEDAAMVRLARAGRMAGFDRGLCREMEGLVSVKILYGFRGFEGMGFGGVLVQSSVKGLLAGRVWR
jgi:hypothetical protein